MAAQVFALVPCGGGARVERRFGAAFPLFLDAVIAPLVAVIPSERSEPRGLRLL